MTWKISTDWKILLIFIQESFQYFPLPSSEGGGKKEQLGKKYHFSCLMNFFHQVDGPHKE